MGVGARGELTSEVSPSAVNLNVFGSFGDCGEL